MYILRPYQQEAVNLGVQFLLNKKEKKNAVIVAPTGSGKSLYLANIARTLDKKVVIFQPSKELLEQNYAKYISYGEKAEIFSASMNRKKISKVTFATIGSVVKKPHLFRSFDYCLIDEAHYVSPKEGTMYQKFFSQLNMKVLGFTATPVRMKTYSMPDWTKHTKICMLDRMRPKFFSKYLYVTQISEMVDNGWFSPTEYYEYDFNTSSLKRNSTGADFTEESIQVAIEQNDTLSKIKVLFERIEAKGIIKHVLIFTDSVSSAERLKMMIGEDKCGIVHGKMKKKDREQTLNDFKSGKLKAVTNCAVLTHGFDFPELDCIITAKPTMSITLHYQIIGRSVRPHHDKNKSYIFDFVGNFRRFGKVEDFVIEQRAEANGWCIHNGKKILTNIPLEELDNPTNRLSASGAPIVKFGKYQDKGWSADQLPDSYVEWLRENLKREPWNKEVFDYIHANN
jgi:DNA repair protein RadD